MQSNRVLAIDPGFDRCGVAILEKSGSKEKILYSHCIVTNPKDPRSKRLLQIGTELRSIITEWNPVGLAIETLFFNKNITSAIGVAEARGLIIFLAGEYGLKVHEYSPQAVKIAVTGYGKASKSDVLRMVERLVKLPSKSKRLDDELDAIAVGITHLAVERTLTV
jgi:crossover junction endodeoxyribonuclease RuvC